MQFRHKHWKILSENTDRLLEENAELKKTLASHVHDLRKSRSENASLRAQLARQPPPRRASPPPLAAPAPAPRATALVDLDPENEERGSPPRQVQQSRKRDRPPDYVPDRPPPVNNRDHSLDPVALSQFEAHRTEHVARATPRGGAARSFVSSQYGAPSSYATAPSRHAGEEEESRRRRPHRPAPAASLRAPLDKGYTSSRPAEHRSSGPMVSSRSRQTLPLSSSVAAAAALGRRSLQRQQQLPPTREERHPAGSSSQVIGLGASSSRGTGLPPSNLSRFARTSSRGAGGAMSAPRAASVVKRTPLTRLSLGGGNGLPRPSATPQQFSRPAKRVRPLVNPVVGRRP